MFHISQLRKIVAKTIQTWGFEESEAEVPFNCSAGKAELWVNQCAQGDVLIRVESYRHNGPRLQLDIGVRLPVLAPVINLVKSEKMLWGGNNWYPHFDFGWSLGQSTRAELKYMERGLNPPVADFDALGESEAVVSLAGQKGGICFSDSAESAFREVESAMIEVENRALGLFLSIARSGWLEPRVFENKWRLCPHYSWAIATAVGRSLLEDGAGARQVLDDEADSLRAMGVAKVPANIVRVRGLIDSLVMMSPYRGKIRDSRSSKRKDSQ